MPPRTPPPSFHPDRAFIEKLPKTDLHVHLDGSLRLETILELAGEQDVALPSNDVVELSQVLHLGQTCQDLTDYLRAFDFTLAVMQDEASLYRVAYELAEDAAKENVRLMEVRYSPMLHTRKGLPLTRIVECVLEGLNDARRDYNILCNIIICGIRHIEPQQSLRLAELSVAYKNKGVVGFDLAGAEYDYPPKAHREAFQLVRNNNVNSTIHAGEAYGAQSIQQAIHLCGAHRIGHGVTLRQDGDLLNYVNDHRLPLEICLSSNVQTQAVTDFKNHPLKFYFDFGIRVTINTDNRLITRTSVTDEYVRAVETFQFNAHEVKQLVINGFKSAFLPFHTRQVMLRKISAELDDLIEHELAARAVIAQGHLVPEASPSPLASAGVPAADPVAAPEALDLVGLPTRNPTRKRAAAKN
jgi:adenosine deaminase